MQLNVFEIFIVSSGVSVRLQQLVFLYNRSIWCFFYFLKSAMTRISFLTFKNFLLYFLTNTLEVDHLDNVSQELIQSHYDCTKMLDNR